MHSGLVSMGSSGSFDDTVFARVLLDSSYDTENPPQINRLSFEGVLSGCNLTASFSRLFPSDCGLPYDRSPNSVDSLQDTHSEHSSRGPSTPENFSPVPDMFSPLSEKKQLDEPLLASSTLFLDTRSLHPSHSLLSSAPYLGLNDSPASPTQARPNTHALPLQSPSNINTTPMSTSVPQTTSRETRPSLDSAYRGVTVQQLALDLPLRRTRSNSLADLIHALEDASPGWYQSLMDSALPEEELQSPQTVPCGSSPNLSRLAASTCTTGNSEPEPSSSGLPPCMLNDLEELELLATKVKALRIPRPRTVALDLFATRILSSSESGSPSLNHAFPSSLIFPPLTLTEEPRSTTVPDPSYGVRGRRVTGTSSMLPTRASADLSTGEDEQALNNLASHPKLSKTLGLRPQSTSARPPAPAPKASTWRSGIQSYQPPPRAAPDRTPPMPPLPIPKTPKAANPPKTPKSLKLQTLFRRRPSAPPVPMLDYDVEHSPVRSVPARRAAHLSEMPKPRPEGTTARHFSMAPQSVRAPQDQAALGSFFEM